MLRIEYFTVAICALVDVQASIQFSEPTLQYDAGVCNDTAINVTGKDISGGFGFYADCDFWAMMVSNESNGGHYTCCISSMYDDDDFTANDMCCACNGNWTWNMDITLNATTWGNLTLTDFLALANMTMVDLMGGITLPSLAEGPCGLMDMGGTTSMAMATTQAPPEESMTTPMISAPATTDDAPTAAPPTPAPTPENLPADASSKAGSRGGALLLHLCMIALGLICVQ
jgi:hypothetical protein